MEELPLDIKILIATITHDRMGIIWCRLMRINDEFDRYARSNAGIKTFIRFATSIPIIIERRKVYFLMSWIHREDDLPAIEEKDGTLAWMRFSLFHREDGKPAVICPCGSKLFLEHGIPTYRMERHHSKFNYYNKVCFDWPDERDAIILQTKYGHITWEKNFVAINKNNIKQPIITLPQNPYLSA